MWQVRPEDVIRAGSRFVTLHAVLELALSLNRGCISIEHSEIPIACFRIVAAGSLEHHGEELRIGGIGCMPLLLDDDGSNGKDNMAGREHCRAALRINIYVYVAVGFEVMTGLPARRGGASGHCRSRHAVRICVDPSPRFVVLQHYRKVRLGRCCGPISAAREPSKPDDRQIEQQAQQSDTVSDICHKLPPVLAARGRPLKTALSTLS